MKASTGHNIIDISSYNWTGFAIYGASTYLQRISSLYSFYFF